MNHGVAWEWRINYMLGALGWRRLLGKVFDEISTWRCEGIVRYHILLSQHSLKAVFLDVPFFVKLEA